MDLLRDGVCAPVEHGDDKAQHTQSATGRHDHHEVIIMSAEDNNREDGLHRNSAMSDVKLLLLPSDEYFYGGCELTMIHPPNSKPGAWCVPHPTLRPSPARPWTHSCGTHSRGAPFTLPIKAFWMNIIHVLPVTMHSSRASTRSLIHSVYSFIRRVTSSFHSSRFQSFSFVLSVLSQC